MKTTVNMEDKSFDKAAKMTVIKGKSPLLRLVRQVLIAMKRARRLVKMGETQKRLALNQRRKSEKS